MPPKMRLPCFLLRKIPEARVVASLGGQAHGSRVDDGKRNVIPAEGNLQGARRSGRQACNVARVRRIRRRGQQRRPVVFG